MDGASFSGTSSSESDLDYQLLVNSISQQQYLYIGKEKYEKSVLENIISSKTPANKNELKAMIIESIKENNEPALEYFIRKNCNIHDIFIEEEGQTAIQIAYYNHTHPYTLKIIRDSLPNDRVNCIDCYGLTYLHIGCWANDKKLIKKCLESHVNINAAINFDPEGCRKGYTALHFASLKSIKVVQLLIQNGADINAEDFLGRKPIHLVCSEFECCDIVCDPTDGQANLQILKLLLDSGCDVNSKDKNGYTPLLSIFPEKYGAAQRLSQVIPIGETILKVKFLLERDADINWSNNNGDTVLHRAIKMSLFSIYPPSYHYKLLIDEAKHAELIEMILNSNKNIDINAKNSLKETPLQLAVSMASAQVVKVLLNHNADMSCLTFNNYDQYVFCYPNSVPKLRVVRNVLNIMEMIIDNGFELNATSSLMIMKFLVHNLENCECSQKILFGWEKIINFASATHCKKMLTKVIDEYSSEGIESTLRGVANFIGLKQISGLFIGQQLVDLIEKMKIKFTFDEDELADIENEISHMKRTVIGNNVTLYDVLTMNPRKIYQYVMNNNLIELPLQDTFPIMKNTIKGHITKSLIRHYVENSAYNYFKKLISPSFPMYCTKLIINYLSNEEIFHVCLATTPTEVPVV